ncbi:ABC transporter permease [candidate division WWE3 bacterium]|nr:ABC transporter permease [candidate division WWE3 bacterium]
MFKRELNAILTIAYRDVVKFLRDRPRIIATFLFPFIFIAVLGGSLNANLGDSLGYNLLVYTFLGVIGQTLFQSTAAGIISLIEDRENDFSQEIFISPISRNSIIFGKILGESLVALAQVIGIIAFGFLIGIPISLFHLIKLIPFVIIACLFGGAFGVLVLANLSNQRAANQIFPFLLLPQYFLAGVFNPIQNLPWYLFYLSRIAPMTYAVDLMRSIYYSGQSEYAHAVLYSPMVNIIVIGIMFTLFFMIGTYLFVRNERNR